MIKVVITQEMLDRAKIRADDIGKLRNSITGGEGNLAGCLAEEALKSILIGSEIEDRFPQKYQYDLIFKGKKIDVKAKRCNSEPRDNYECSVAEINTSQECDYYAFARVLYENGIPTMVYIVGYIAKDDFYKQAVHHKKGEKDTNVVTRKDGSKEQFTFTADCYNMAIKDLNKFKEEALPTPPKQEEPPAEAA